MNLTPNEIRILQMMRELKTFERIEVSKDKDGHIDSWFVHRSQKFLLTTPDEFDKIKIQFNK